MNKKILTLLCIFVFIFSTINVGAATFAVFKPSAVETIVLPHKTSADVITDIQTNTVKSSISSPAHAQLVFNNPKTIDFIPVRFNPIQNIDSIPSVDSEPEIAEETEVVDTEEEAEPSAAPVSSPASASAASSIASSSVASAAAEVGVLQQALNSDCPGISHETQPNVLHFACIEISSPRLVGQDFTITVTAEDSDDNVVALTLGRAPYSSEDDWEPQTCSPPEHSCTKTWTLSEDAVGTYTYKIKAKNERNQIVSHSVDVAVEEGEMTTPSFIFVAAAIDGALFDTTSQKEYINSTIRIYDPLTSSDQYVEQVATPFATFDVLSNRALELRYSAEGFMPDTDYFYFDERLPACAGDYCSFSGSGYTTDCSFVAFRGHYDCTLSNDNFNDAIRFTYRAHGDALGDHVVRVFNPMYRVHAPILNLENAPRIEFDEGMSYTTTFSLNDYIVDDDTPLSELLWSISDNEYVDVLVNDDRTLTITPYSETFIGEDIITVTVSDGVYSDSDLLYITVNDIVNGFPTIYSYFPDSPVNLLEGQSQGFGILVSDPEDDPLNIIWVLDGTVVRVDNLGYTYTAPSVDVLESHVLSVTVSDGTNSDSFTWLINVLPDTDAPQVASLACVPNPQEQGLSVLCSATVTDDIVVSSVELEITYPNSAQNTFTMTNVGGDVYSLDFTDTLQTGVYNARAIATDIEGNVNSAETTLFIIEPVPGSGNTTTLITTPEDNQNFAVADEFDVNATIAAAGTVTGCTATITFDTSILSQVGPDPQLIIEENGTSQISWRLRAANLGTTNIRVDTVCNEGSSSYDIVVNIGVLTEINPPSVVNVNAVPDPQTQGSPVTISADVTDDTGVDTVSVRITYPNSATTEFGMANVGGDTYSYDFTDTLQTGTYSATILALDVFGNLNDTESVQFVIEPVTGAGDSSTIITSPNDGDAFNVSDVFDVNATVSAVGGSLTNCQTSITFNTTMFSLVSGSNPVILGDMFDGQTHYLSWQLLAESEGTSNIRVDTICVEGSSSYDIVVNVGVLTPLDTINPTVENVAASPDPQEQGSPVTISANVTDDVAVDTVDVRVTYPDSTQSTFGMSNVGDIYYYEFNDTTQTGVYTATIVATDTSGNVNDTESVQFTINPVVGAGNSTTVITTPVDGQQVLQNSTLEVNTTVSAVGTITDCTVTLSIEGSSFSFISGDTASVPVLTDASVVVSWQLNATQLGSSNLTANTVCVAGSASSDSVFDVTVVEVVGDTTNPVVLDVTAVPDTADQGSTVTVSANVSDDVALDTVQVRITYPDSTESLFDMVNVGGDLYSYDFADTTQTGVYTATIVAADTSGNVNDTEFVTFTINPLPGAGNSSTTITTPADGSVFNLSDSFKVNATIAASGNLTECNASISFGTIMFTVAGSDTAVLGNMSDGDSVLVSWDLTASQVGNGSIIVTTQCVEGASSSDAVNVTVLPPAVNIPPTATITSPGDGSSFPNGTQVNFTGTGDDAEDGPLTGASLVWESSIDGVLGTGESLNISTLTIGEHNITLTATDSGGLTGSDTITINITPAGPVIIVPAVVLVSPENNTQINNTQTVTFEFIVYDDSAVLDCSLYLDGVFALGTAVMEGQLTSLTLFNVAWGPHDWYVNCTDALLNTGMSDVYTFDVVDTELPSVVINSPTATTYYVTNITVDIAATDNIGVDSVWFEYNGTDIPYTIPVEIEFEDNTTYTLTAYANDSYGNVGSASVTFTVNTSALDREGPNITIINPADGSTIGSTTVALDFGVADPSGVSWCGYSVDSGTITELPNCMSTTFDTTVGTHTVTVYANDTLGNEANASSTFTVSLTGTIAGVVTDAVTGLPLAGVAVQAIQGSGLVADAVTDGTGAYSIDVEQGTYDVRALLTGYLVTTVTDVQVNALQTTVVDISLVPAVTTGDLTGVVSDSDNTIYNALLELKQGSSTLYSTTSDQDGNYLFSGAEEGEYTLRVTKAGFEVQNIPVTISAGSTATQDVLLVPSSGSGTILGTVWDTTFVTVPDADVFVYETGTSNLIQVVKSDGAGNYKVNGLVPSIAYDLNATKLPTYTTTVVGPTNVIVPIGGTSSGNDIVIQ